MPKPGSGKLEKSKLLKKLTKSQLINHFAATTPAGSRDSDCENIFTSGRRFPPFKGRWHFCSPFGPKCAWLTGLGTVAVLQG